jgi:8-oxo-dGTP pyrophosphatase MutT (NUDIX family)
MPPEAAPRQGLYSRFACVALFGTGKILHLFRRVFPGVGFEGRWDFCFGPVRPGEAREDAARRLLLEQAGLADLRTVEILRRPADADLPGHLTFFSARLPLGGILDDREFLAVDADELEGLVAHCPDFFTPALLWAAGGGWLFS